VWTEDFSSGTAAPLPLTTYLSPAYTADADWLPGYNACNGWILNSNNATAPSSDSGCAGTGGQIVLNGKATAGLANTRGVWLYLRRMAYQLGVAQGDPAPASNNVLASMTNGNKPQNASIQFATNSPQYPATVTPGHFYIGSAWFAQVHCRAEDSSWYNSSEAFTLLIQGGTSNTLASGFTPCLASMGNTIPDGNGANQIGNLHVGQMLTPGWLAPSGVTAVGVQISNATPNYPGNDVALDTPQVLDATPQLYKSFNPDPASSSDYTVATGGQTVRLTFIIVNTTDYQEKRGWSFTDTLTGGITAASPLNASTTCAAATVTSPAPNTIVVTNGDLQAGTANNGTCSVSVDVVAPVAMGTYTNGPSNITDIVGLLPPETATLNVADLILEKTATIVDVNGNSVPEVLQAGDVITYTFTVTNPTSASIFGLTLREISFNGDPLNIGKIDFSDPLTGCNNAFKPGPSGTGTEIPAGGSVSCTGTYTVLSSDMDISAPAAITNAAAVDSTVPSGTSPQSSTTVQVDKPALTVTKTASTTQLVAGDDVTFYFLIQNTGNVNLSDVSIDDTLFTGSGALSSVTCPATTLAMGASMTCSADYTVTAADVSAGTISNTADARGTVMGSLGGGALTALETIVSTQSTVLLRVPSATSTVPTLDTRMLALLALLLGGLAVWSARRRVWE